MSSGIGELKLTVGSITASVNPAVIPKNVSSGVRISVTNGGEELSAEEVRLFLGGQFTVEGTLSGPGLTHTVNGSMHGEVIEDLSELPAVTLVTSITLRPLYGLKYGTGYVLTLNEMITVMIHNNTCNGTGAVCINEANLVQSVYWGLK